MIAARSTGDRVYVQGRDPSPRLSSVLSKNEQGKKRTGVLRKREGKEGSRSGRSKAKTAKKRSRAGRRRLRRSGTVNIPLKVRSEGRFAGRKQREAGRLGTKAGKNPSTEKQNPQREEHRPQPNHREGRNRRPLKNGGEQGINSPGKRGGQVWEPVGPCKTEKEVLGPSYLRPEKHC